MLFLMTIMTTPEFVSSRCPPHEIYDFVGTPDAR